MDNENYCKAAADTAAVFLKNPLRIATVIGLGNVYEFFGKLCISLSTTLTCYLIITNTPYYTTRLNSPVPSTIFFFIISFCIGSYFMNIFSTSSDALLYTFLWDESEGGIDKNAPAELRKLVEDNDTSKKNE